MTTEQLQQVTDGLNAVERALVERLAPIETALEKLGALGAVDSVEMIKFRRFEISPPRGAPARGPPRRASEALGGAPGAHRW